MKFLFDFFPVVLFFLAYKFYGQIPSETIAGLNALLPLGLEAGRAGHAIYLATAVGITATFLQVSLYWLKNRRFERMHLISLTIFILAGGATIALKDPVFVYWKPTILNGLFALVFLGSHFIGERTIVERLMSQAMQAPPLVWRRLNLAWIAYFVVLGGTNLYVAYHYSEATWVDFKLFGWLGLTIAFVLLQAVYLARYAGDAAPKEGS